MRYRKWLLLQKGFSEAKTTIKWSSAGNIAEVNCPVPSSVHLVIKVPQSNFHLSWPTQINVDTLTNVYKFLSDSATQKELITYIYAHTPTKASMWSRVISFTGLWRTAGTLIKFDCSLCWIYNSLHFSAFNKLRIQRGSPKLLPQICAHTRMHGYPRIFHPRKFEVQHVCEYE